MILHTHSPLTLLLSNNDRKSDGCWGCIFSSNHLVRLHPRWGSLLHPRVTLGVAPPAADSGEETFLQVSATCVPSPATPEWGGTQHLHTRLNQSMFLPCLRFSPEDKTSSKLKKEKK